MTTRINPRIPQSLVKGQPTEVIRFFQQLVTKPNVGYDISDLTALISNTAALIADVSDAALGQEVTAPDAPALPITSATLQGDGTTTAFLLPSGWNIITDKQTINVYIDGDMQSASAYEVVAGTITFDQPPPVSTFPNIFIRWIPDAVAVAVLANQTKARYNAMALALNAWVITVSELVNALKVDGSVNAQSMQSQKTSFNDLLSNLRNSTAIEGSR